MGRDVKHYSCARYGGRAGSAAQPGRAGGFDHRRAGLPGQWEPGKLRAACEAAAGRGPFISANLTSLRPKAGCCHLPILKAPEPWNAVCTDCAFGATSRHASPNAVSRPISEYPTIRPDRGLGVVSRWSWRGYAKDEDDAAPALEESRP